MRGIYDMKFAKPSQIQAKTIPSILKGINVIGQAQTGSGKSACFLIGMLCKIDPTQNCTQVRWDECVLSSACSQT